MATESSSRSSRNSIATESNAGILDLECRRFFLSGQMNCWTRELSTRKSGRHPGLAVRPLTQLDSEMWRLRRELKVNCWRRGVRLSKWGLG
jgi:hypothetical protein